VRPNDDADAWARRPCEQARCADIQGGVLAPPPSQPLRCARSLPARFLASRSPCKSLTYLEATPGIEPGYTVLPTVTRLVLPGELAEREVYELRNCIARAGEHIERRLQEAIADDKVVELSNWRRDGVA